MPPGYVDFWNLASLPFFRRTSITASTYLYIQAIHLQPSGQQTHVIVFYRYKTLSCVFFSASIGLSFLHCY